MYVIIYSCPNSLHKSHCTIIYIFLGQGQKCFEMNEWWFFTIFQCQLSGRCSFIVLLNMPYSVFYTRLMTKLIPMLFSLLDTYLIPHICIIARLTCCKHDQHPELLWKMYSSWIWVFLLHYYPWLKLYHIFQCWLI